MSSSTLNKRIATLEQNRRAATARIIVVYLDDMAPGETLQEYCNRTGRPALTENDLLIRVRYDEARDIPADE